MDKHCADCIYRCYITAGLYCCDYIGCTGHARSLICRRRTLHREKDSSTHPAESKREAKGRI